MNGPQSGPGFRSNCCVTLDKPLNFSGPCLFVRIRVRHAEPSGFQTVFHGTLGFRAGGDVAGEAPGSSDTGSMYALEEENQRGDSGETGLCPREEQGSPPIEEATLEWGAGGREGRRGRCVYAGNQSPRLWLLVFRDKLISLIW